MRAMAAALLTISAASAWAAPPIGRPEYAPVIHERIVLERDPPERWGQGRPSLLWAADDHHEVYIAMRPAREKLLPPRALAWKGKEIETVHRRGKTCVRRVSGFEILSIVLPDADRANRWASIEEDHQTIADESFGLGARYLVARWEGRCPETGVSMWAHVAARRPAGIVFAEPADQATTTALLHELQRVPGHAKALARLLRGEIDEAARNPTQFLLKSSQTDARRLSGLDEQRGPGELFVLSVSRGRDCRGVPKRLLYVWSRHPDSGALRLESPASGESPTDVQVTAAVYLGKRGPPVLSYESHNGSGVLRPGPRGYAPDPALSATVRELATPRKRECSPGE